MVLDTLNFYTFLLVFSTPHTSLHGFECNLTGMLHLKSRSECGEIIHVQQILTVMILFTKNFYTFLLVFSTPPTSLRGFE